MAGHPSFSGLTGIPGITDNDLHASKSANPAGKTTFPITGIPVPVDKGPRRSPKTKKILYGLPADATGFKEPMSRGVRVVPGRVDHKLLPKSSRLSDTARPVLALWPFDSTLRDGPSRIYGSLRTSRHDASSAFIH